MMSIWTAIRSRDLARPLSRHSDLLLAALVVGVVAMMIIPLPTFLLDLLITTNICIAVTLLLISIYVGNPLNIASLPSILLITTLFRLGLNVSSTRLILLQADAGSVISSFGDFVVAGNLVVGAVIFLILTMIQFIVVAKGSERVAEVAARFALDAMPGKQMAIDADVRAGSITMDDARAHRKLLQRESQLYGAMDGAMKFVKGDAIAGILITLVNIIGGLLIGVFQQKMAVADAASLYSVLTIGDGLVSQIPALLVSTAAGIVVTRVASEEEGAHLGRDIGAQVLAQPKPIIIAAGLFVLLALVPGLPGPPFLVLAVVGGIVGLNIRKRAPLPSVPTNDDFLPDETEDTAASQVALEVGEGLAIHVDRANGGGRLMQELIPGLRQMLRRELGVALPGVHIRENAEELGLSDYRICLADIPMARGHVAPNTVVVLSDAAELQAAGFAEAEPIILIGLNRPAAKIDMSAEERLRDQGFQILDIPTRLVLHLGALMREYAHEFVGIQEAQHLLDELEQSFPTLVQEVVPKTLSIQALAEVLRRLVEEDISIRNMREILQALAEWGGVEKDTLLLTEYVRMALKREISYRHAGDERLLRAYLLDPMIEEAVRDSIHRAAKGAYLAMEPQLGRDIIDALGKELAELPADEPAPVVLTNSEIRRYLRRLIEVDHPQISVLSFTEVLSDVTIQPLARVSVG
jgi:type III secretion protein V